MSKISENHNITGANRAENTRRALLDYFDSRGARPCNQWSDSTGESGFAVYFDSDWWSVTIHADGVWSSRLTTLMPKQIESLRIGD